MENNQNFFFDSVEDYYGLPAYMSEYDIEKIVIDAINSYNDGKYSYDDIVRILYSLGDRFSYNIEEMDLSGEIRGILENFVFELWDYRDKNNLNGELLIKVIIDFGLQESYNKIINNIEVFKNSNDGMYMFLNEVVDVNGKDITNIYFKKHKSNKNL